MKHRGDIAAELLPIGDHELVMERPADRQQLVSHNRHEAIEINPLLPQLLQPPHGGDQAEVVRDNAAAFNAGPKKSS